MNGAEPPSSSQPPVSPPVTTYGFGRFTVDLAGQRLLRDGEPVPLTPKVFETLVVLVRHRDRVVSKDELLSAVWPDTFVSEDSLVQNISILRRTLGDEAGLPRFIATSARRGYRFVADVTEGPEGAPKGSTAPAAVSHAAAEGGPTAAGPSTPRTAARHLWFIAAAAALLGVIVGLFANARLYTAPVAPATVLLTAPTPDGTSLASGGALSPDGRSLAFVARDDEPRIWVWDLRTGRLRRLEGTEGASGAFWSPDSSELGFFARNEIKRIRVASSTVRVIGKTIGSRPRGGTWSSRGIVIYQDGGGLYSLPAAGGAATLLRSTDASRGESRLEWPQFLPDGNTFLFSVTSSDPNRTGTYLASLSGGEAVRILPDSGQSVAFVPPASLLFVRDGLLMRQTLDVASRTVQGVAIPVAERQVSNASISGSAHNVIAFGGGETGRRLMWFSRDGREDGPVPGPEGISNLSLSPDGQRLVANGASDGRIGTWLIDLRRGVPMELVPNAWMPSWAPDGRRMALTQNAGGRNGLYIRATDTHDARLVIASDELKFVTDWTRDDAHVLYVAWSPQTRQDLWVLPLRPQAAPRAYLNTVANEVQGQVSPDGRWIAYASDESGEVEVYIDSFPTASAKMAVSHGGGGQPQWRADGRELFYLTPDGTLMAVAVESGPRLRLAMPAPLLRVDTPGALLDARNYYVPSPDGQRFLVATRDQRSAEPISVMVNWTSGN